MASGERNLSRDLSPQPARRPAPRTITALSLITAAVVLVIDQTTKYWVTSTVAPYPASAASVFGGWLSITYTTNSGAAFGVLADQGVLFLLVGLVVLCILYVYMRVLPGRRRMLQLSLGLQLGGAAGNLLDRVRIGHVVDFIHVRHWPVFNLADTAIFAGVLVMMYYISFGAGEPGRPGKQTPAQAEPHPVNGN